VEEAPGRQSLVTPIDWKHQNEIIRLFTPQKGRQSLVTPIDWKRLPSLVDVDHAFKSPFFGDLY